MAKTNQSKKFCCFLKLDKGIIVASAYYLVMFPLLLSSISADTRKLLGTEEEEKQDDLETYYFILGIVCLMSLYVGAKTVSIFSKLVSNVQTLKAKFQRKSMNIFFWLLLSPIYIAVNILTTFFGRFPLSDLNSEKIITILRILDVIAGLVFYYYTYCFYKGLVKTVNDEGNIYDVLPADAENPCGYVDMTQAKNVTRYQSNPGASTSFEE
jgi:hypothetical protein